MGRFKLTLPWGAMTVIGQVLLTLDAAGITEIIVVTGNRQAEVAAAAQATGVSARLVHNPDYASGEMLSSIQVGLAALTAEGRSASKDAELRTRQLRSPASSDAGSAAAMSLHPAVLLCLGDQPQMQVTTVQALLAAGAASGWQHVVIPSYNLRAGHPILLPRRLWPAILAATDNLRRVLADHRAMVEYLTLHTPSILADLDTPEDYERARSSCA